MSKPRKTSAGKLRHVTVLPCGCPVANIPTTLELEGLEGPEAVQGYTCRCGKCFTLNPKPPKDIVNIEKGNRERSF